MEATVTTETLARAVKVAQAVVEKHPDMPVLSCVRLEAERRGVLRLTVTDLEVSLHATLPADVRRAGTTLAPVKRLAALLKVAPLDEEELTLSANRRALTLESGPARWRLLVPPAQDYPAVPVPPLGELATFATGSLGTALARIEHAMGKDDGRPSLCGAHFEQGPGSRVRFTATDGHRLAFADAISEDVITAAELLPRKAVLAMNKLLAVSAGDVRFGVIAKDAILETSSFVLMARLVAEQFPDYASIIPRPAASPVMVHRDALLEAVRRVSVVGDRIPQVRFEAQGRKLRVQCEEVEIGESVETVHAEVPTPAAAGFNATYLQEALASLTSARVRLTFTDGSGPLLIQPDGDEEEGGEVVMPMRL